MAQSDDDRPRTHRWIRPQGEPRRPDAKPGQLTVHIPDGAPPAAEDLAEAMREALAGWPIVVLRVVGHAHGKLKLGRNPGRWVRTRLGDIIDNVLDGGGSPRITNPNSPAHRLLGRHGRGNKPDGEAWAPFVVRAHGMPEALGDNGGDLRFELAIAGAKAVSEVPALVAAMRAGHRPPPGEPKVDWRTIQALQLDEDGDPRWKTVPQGADKVSTVALDKISEPRVRKGRMVFAFLTATPLARRGDVGEAVPEFPLLMDRLCRSMGAWMGRTSHRGPRIPVDDALRASAQVVMVNDGTTKVEVPTRLIAAEGAQIDAEERIAAVEGVVTYRGDLAGLAPLLRAAHWVGMGPGRQHGLGQVAIR
jgi:hypothetical protein